MRHFALERGFEEDIAETLKAEGWTYIDEGDSRGFDQALALYIPDVEYWLSTQYPDEWEKVIRSNMSMEQVAVNKRLLFESLAKQLDETPRPNRTEGGSIRGLLGILRNKFQYRNGPTTAKFGPMVGFYPANPLVTSVQKRAESNRLRVLRQVQFDTKTNETIDLVLTVNGIPVVTIELKTDNTQSIEYATEQYKLDRKPSSTRRLLKPGRALVHFAVSNTEAKMTTTLAGESTVFLPFNQGDGEHGGNPYNPKGSETAYLWEKILEPKQFLRILQHYAVWQPSKSKNKGNLIFPRFHQLRAVERIVNDIEANGVGNRYLIQHSAGSGKTMTISWLAHRLARHFSGEHKTFDSIIVITDRRVLDRNIRDGIDLLPSSHGLVVQVGTQAGAKSPQLAKALEEGGKIITCTLQTFPEVLDRIKKDRLLGNRNWCVIADEAHSSQTGSSARALRELLTMSTQSTLQFEDGDSELDAVLAATDSAIAASSNVTYVAFTATPKAKTMRLFGTQTEDERFVPFDIYTMAQAIEEGFILDVLTNYSSYRSYIKVHDRLHREDLHDKAELVGEIVRYARQHPKTIAEKVPIVLEHFRRNVQHLLEGEGRAMVVTGSRKEAVRWKQQMDKYIASKHYSDLDILVAFSGEVEDHGITYTEESMNGVRDVETAFKAAGSNYRMLVVAEKFQTGFDEPRLCAMYVDKGLSGVATVQTLSRLNRIAKGKPAPMVLDFVNDPGAVLNDFRQFYTTAELPGDVELQQIDSLADDLDIAGFYTQDQLNEIGEIYFNTPEANAHEQFRSAIAKIARKFNHGMVEARKAGDDDEVEHYLEFRSNLQSYLKGWEFLSQIIDFKDPIMAKRAVMAKFVLRNITKYGGREALDLSGVDVLGALTFENKAEQDLGLTTRSSNGSEIQLTVPTLGGGVAGEGTIVHIAFDKAVEEANKVLERYGFNSDDAADLIRSMLQTMLDDPLVVTTALENTEEQLAISKALQDASDQSVIEHVMKAQSQSSVYFNDPEVGETLKNLMAHLVHTAVHSDKQGNATN